MYAQDVHPLWITIRFSLLRMRCPLSCPFFTTLVWYYLWDVPWWHPWDSSFPSLQLLHDTVFVLLDIHSQLAHGGHWNSLLVLPCLGQIVVLGELPLIYITWKNRWVAFSELHFIPILFIVQHLSFGQVYMCTVFLRWLCEIKCVYFELR